ncbi:catechol O-methyltransferase domain-containing protein 1 [Microcaecilia unicolor]|uniref:Catechol O-methyltransferase domain-containing protein 1 n=1 Tax=Microcaecilia unicolor TaxID=1415580 RepID=A0A6P7Y1V5_9AMPH|nr:catechol O-methyltransferase domain-containing protein 1 [Microcaecilia unicolor]
MPVFRLSKEVLAGTAVLGAFAAGVIIGKKWAILHFGTRNMHNTLPKRDDPLIDYVLRHSLREHPLLKKLRLRTMEEPEGMIMVCCDQAQFMANLAKLICAKKVLEIGVFTGYKALNMALALPDDGKVVGCEVNNDYINIGKPFWKKAGVEHKIDVRIKPAIETLDELLVAGEAGTYDFAFIDADKQSYNEYYEKCLRLVRKGGIIAIDNVFWHRKVLKPDKNDTACQAIQHLNEKILRDVRVNISMITMADGVTLAFKL